MRDHAEHVAARHVGRGKASGDARHRASRINIDTQQLTRCHGTADEAHDQFAGQRAQVVQVRRLARHVAECRIVGNRFSDAGHCSIQFS